MKLFLVPILVLLFTVSAYAQDADKIATETRISKQSATETGDRGLFTVPSVETLNKGQYSFGFGWSDKDRSPRDLDISSFPLFVSYGLLGRLTVTGAFETERQIRAGNLIQLGFNSAYPFVNQRVARGYGDTILSAKYRLKRRPDNIGGMSLRGFAKLGTADAKTGLGSGATDIGVDLLFTSLLPLNFLMDSSMGYTSLGNAKNPVTGDIRRFKNEMRSGLGAAWPAAGLNLFKGSVQGIFEYTTVTYIGGGSSNAGASVQNPSDIAAGIRYLMLNSGLTFNAGYRKNLKLDLSVPANKDRYGFVFSISYTKPVRPPGNNRFPVVSLETSDDEIAVGSSATITATGYDADNDPLTYSWSASGGRIVGSGEKVTFNSAGLAPGKYTIRTTASDGKGGTATSAIEVTVRP